MKVTLKKVTKSLFCAFLRRCVALLRRRREMRLISLRLRRCTRFGASHLSSSPKANEGYLSHRISRARVRLRQREANKGARRRKQAREPKANACTCFAFVSPSAKKRDAKQHERFGASHLSRRSEGHLSLRYTSLAEGEEERLGVAESNPEMRRDSVHSLRRCTYGARDAKANSRYPEIF